MKKEILKYEDIGKDVEYLYGTHFNRLHVIYTLSLALPFLLVLLIMLLISNTSALVLLPIVIAIIAAPLFSGSFRLKKASHSYTQKRIHDNKRNSALRDQGC